MQKKIVLKNKKGFSLLEMLVYVSILSTTLVLVTNIVLAMLNSYGDLEISKHINVSVSSALERMSREIRWAYDTDDTQSIYNTSPGKIFLKIKDPSGTNRTVEFYVEDDILKIKEDGVAKGGLIQSNTKVTSLVFRSLNLGRSKMIKVEMTLSSTSKKGKIRSENFYDSIVLRGGY